MDIGKLIHNRRKELGLTLEDIGNFVGVGKSTVKKWETGAIANIKRDKIAKLAQILQLHPIVLVNGEYPDDTNFTYALFRGDEEITDEMQDEVAEYAASIKKRPPSKESKPSIDEKILNEELIHRLCSLNNEELARVDAFVQGLLANRST